MPLNPDAVKIIRANLELLKEGGRPKVVSIGYLTQEQHKAINALRDKEGKPRLESPEILFMGRHMYASRSDDGYTIDDIIAMIESALCNESEAVPHAKMTGMINYKHRTDAYGNKVQDLAVLELYARRPKAELFSVIPKGDTKPKERPK